MSLYRYFPKQSKAPGETDVAAAAADCALTAREEQSIKDHMKSLQPKDLASSRKRKRASKYKPTDPNERYEIAQYASKYGNRPAATKYGVSESTIRGYRTALAEQEKQPQVDNRPKNQIHAKKRGRRTLLPAEIDAKVMEVARNLRLNGAVVNYNVLISIAKGIVSANDRTLLKENGGDIILSYKWCESIFKRMNWSNRKGTTAKASIAPGLIREVGFAFYKQVSEIVHAHNIPPKLIINIDQTPLPYVLISKYTMNKKGEKKVPILGTDDYRQITGTFSVAMDGSFLPIQLIYKGKTSRSQPKYKFPKEFHVTQNPTHWANETTSIELLEKIIIPYVKRTRETLGLPEDHAWLLISDVFKAQWTELVKQTVSDSSGYMVPIPSCWTNYFQPLDLTVNKSSKSHLRNSAQTWYAGQIEKQIEAGKSPHEIKVDIRISLLKPLQAKWIVQFYDFIRNNPSIVLNGWKKSKIPEHIHANQITLDPFA